MYTPGPFNERQMKGLKGAIKKPLEGFKDPLKGSKTMWGRGCSYMGVSKNNGTPLIIHLIGFSIIKHPFWGTPIFGNIHIEMKIISWKSKDPQFNERFLLALFPSYHFVNDVSSFGPCEVWQAAMFWNGNCSLHQSKFWLTAWSSGTANSRVEAWLQSRSNDI